MAPDGGIHYENPFITPQEARDPVRRLRGRLAAPVTLWTAGSPDEPFGLTMSSVLIAEGDPAVVFGLMKPGGDLLEAIRETGAFVVHVLDESHQALADVFAGLRPSPGGMFAGLDIVRSDWGPVLTGIANRAYCRLQDVLDAGYLQLVRGCIDRIEPASLEDPLVYFRGRYRRLD